MRITASDFAVLRFGPLPYKWGPASRGTVIMADLASIAIYLVLFIWYANTAIAHTYPTDHTNFWFGFLHGYFTGPSFIVSWFIHDVTIYQSPNDGFSYNLGFLIGLVVLLRTVRS
jgi:hypothetical protein